VVEANGDVVSWSYDPTYQLTHERRSGANSYNVTHTYDAVGNRTLKEDSGARTTYTYNAGNQLLTEQSPTAVTSYTYDANGNTTVKNEAGTRTSYTYDGENRLTQVDTGASSVTYTYDGDGQRRTAPNRQFVWDGQKVLLEKDNTGSTVVQYTLSNRRYGNLISQRRSGASSFYHFDGLGSTDRLTDVNQAVTDSYTYLAFGEEKASGGNTPNGYRYVGRSGYYRESIDNLLFLRARYYWPQLGRFVTVDPIRGGNQYRYTANNPVNGVDPSGNIVWWIRCLLPCGLCVGRPLAALAGCLAGSCHRTRTCGPCVNDVLKDYAGAELADCISCFTCLVGLIGGGDQRPTPNGHHPERPPSDPRPPGPVWPDDPILNCARGCLLAACRRSRHCDHGSLM
jgi:RHS repeat-associated protein